MTEVIQRRPNSCTSDSSSNNSNRNSIHVPSNKRKSNTASPSSSSHCTVTVKYILFLTLILLGITIQHQWEHSISSSSSSSSSTTSTTKLKTTSIQSTIAAAAQPSSNPLQLQQQLPQTKMNPDTNQHRATTIAYVVTITSCEGHERDNTFQIVEGASVLRHSIHMNSIRSQNSSNNNNTSSIYDYQLYAFYHPDAVACAIPLLEFGYIIEARPTPVQVADIQNPLLRERIVKNGCCGEKELIKLEAFTLTSYPLVVLLDIDTLILQPLDRLFQFMLLPSKEEKDHPPTRPQRTTIPLDDDDLLYYPNKPALGGRNTNVTIDFHSSSSSSIDFLYTTDYAMVNADRYIKPVQGGFVILRPNRTIYNDFIHIVQVGDFQFEGNTDLGWGGRTGRFWGAMTFQGLMPYYFQILYPDRALELNWCRYNNMCSPVYDTKKNDPTYKKCVTQQEHCEDCRLRSIQNISLIHFTVCQKPWLCFFHASGTPDSQLCRAFHQQWFRVRSLMEQSWGRSGIGPSQKYHMDHFYGYCKFHGKQGYHPLQKPYGLPLPS